jgi:PAS domain S-box-containing protein
LFAFKAYNMDNRFSKLRSNGLNTFYESIIELQGELICRFLPDTTLTFVNKAYCDYYGDSKENLIGKKFTSNMPEIQQQEILSYIRKVGETGKVAPYVHQVIINGEQRWHQWTDYPIYDKQGNLTEFQSVGRDITETKDYERRLIDLNRTKDHILTTVAHDLRSPISGIIGLCRMMERNNPGKENSIYLKLIQESCNISLHIMEELLEMAELENENFRMEKSVHNLNEIIQDVLTGHELLAFEKGIKIKEDLPSEDVIAMINRPRLQRVLTNLMNNSLKFTLEGGQIIITLRKVESMAVIKVIDSGIGIPSQSIPGIFDKFTKSKRSGLKGEKTHGLGLFICKQIVNLHQGNIFLESEEASGTTVIIELPLQ